MLCTTFLFYKNNRKYLKPRLFWHMDAWDIFTEHICPHYQYGRNHSLCKCWCSTFSPAPVSLWQDSLCHQQGLLLLPSAALSKHLMTEWHLFSDKRNDTDTVCYCPSTVIVTHWHKWLTQKNVIWYDKMTQRLTESSQSKVCRENSNVNIKSQINYFYWAKSFGKKKNLKHDSVVIVIKHIKTFVIWNKTKKKTKYY